VIEAVVAGMFAERCPVVTGIVVSNLRTPGGHVEVTGWARVSRSAGDQGRSRRAGATVDLSDRLLATTGTGALPIFAGGQAREMYRHDPPPTIAEQAHLGMANQQAVLDAAGATFADVFRSNWYLTDMRDWDVVEPIVGSYFPDGVVPVPAVVEVSRLTAKQGVRFEPDLWAALPK
jgi:enamine deaminase RidA (YjgF/YER057c/UK114 family)